MVESCRLVTTEQYEEWKRADEEIDELTKQLIKVNKLWEQTIKANKMYGKKLDIAIRALKETQEKLLQVELSGLDGNNRQKMYDLMFADGVIDKALKEMEEV